MKSIFLKFQVFGRAEGNLLILKFVFHYRIINTSCAQSFDHYYQRFNMFSCVLTCENERSRSRSINWKIIYFFEVMKVLAFKVGS